MHKYEPSKYGKKPFKISQEEVKKMAEIIHNDRNEPDMSNFVRSKTITGKEENLYIPEKWMR